MARPLNLTKALNKLTKIENIIDKQSWINKNIVPFAEETLTYNFVKTPHPYATGDTLNSITRIDKGVEISGPTTDFNGIDIGVCHAVWVEFGTGIHANDNPKAIDFGISSGSFSFINKNIFNKQGYWIYPIEIDGKLQFRSTTGQIATHFCLDTCNDIRKYIRREKSKLIFKGSKLK